MSEEKLKPCPFCGGKSITDLIERSFHLLHIVRNAELQHVVTH